MQTDIAIVGAGPAGMSAAIALQKRGARVTVFDEQPTPGGQIYRNVEANRATRAGVILGGDYLAGLPLVDAFRASGATYVPRATVWRIDAQGLSWHGAGESGECTPRRIILATGAMERPFPLEGWTLPGVMTAGAAQILLKTTGVAAEGAVFVGCGPLFYLVIHQYLQAGVPIQAVFDTGVAANRMPAARHLPAALAAPAYLVKGIKLLAALRRSGVPVHRGIEDIAFEGDGGLEAVRWRDAIGEHRLACGHAFIHQGVIPNVNAAMGTRCAHRWDERQLSWQPVTDASGRTDLDWLLIAGDAGSIGGAKSAAMSGEIVGLTAAFDLGLIASAELETLTTAIAAKRRRDLAVRPFLDTLYRPSEAHRRPAGDNIVLCRCEEVTRGMVVAAAAEGCPGPNQLKSFTRAGMGPCQGRLCGHTIAEIFAGATDRSPADVGYFRIRTPIKPVTLGEIAGIHNTKEQPQ